ncbi:MAG TPA: pyridoxal-dependent decarboxylase, exosortase A system-associated [Sphingomonadaceae bacterium]|nr:pyridoxal-dependent decarboxylase, exosortase A system-associated [Sphingomonadaceae bacterium]
MKKTGPIPAHFARDGAELRIGGRAVSDLVAEAGDTPLFVYDRGAIDAKAAAFRAAFGTRVALHYAMKANPYPPLLRHMIAATEGIDVASAGEMRMALDAGADAEHLSFAGPGKRDDDLAAALTAGITLHCESEGEAARTIAIAAGLDLRPRIAVRVNPDFEIKGSGMRMGGGAKPFGVDAVRVPALVRHLLDAGVDWRGFHIYSGSQTLDATAIIGTQAQTLALAGRLADAVGETPPLVNLGGGFGIPYFAGDTPLDIDAVAEALSAEFNNLPQSLANTRFALEFGRWLVGEAGVYLTRIVDRKQSHGRTFLVTDGGLQHQLAASGNFGQVIRRNFPVAIASRWDGDPAEEATIVGCLCTPLDLLGDEIVVPRADVGDVVAVFVAGAYGLSASPQAFLGQRGAIEMLV